MPLVSVDLVTTFFAKTTDAIERQPHYIDVIRDDTMLLRLPSSSFELSSTYVASATTAGIPSRPVAFSTADSVANLYDCHTRS